MPRVTDYARTLAALPYLDAQFAAPQRPALRPEVQLIRCPDGVVLDGVAEPVRLRGQATRLALAALLPLLDGRRDRAGLAADSGLAEPTVRQLIGLLSMRGVLQDGPATAEPDASLRYLSRAVARTGWHDRAEAAAGQLSTAEVAVLGSSALAAAIRAALTGPGLLGRVSNVESAGCTLVVCCVESADQLARYLTGCTLPVLPVISAGRQLHFGPYLCRDSRP
ncbi:MAG: hypothetical protein ABI418_21795, partial [Jatrophihabitantaceae bacterium]